jgi:hypothetical protein
VLTGHVDYCIGCFLPGSCRITVCSLGVEIGMKQKLLALPGMTLIALIAVLELIAILLCDPDHEENGYD